MGAGQDEVAVPRERQVADTEEESRKQRSSGGVQVAQLDSRSAEKTMAGVQREVRPEPGKP